MQKHITHTFWNKVETNSMTMMMNSKDKDWYFIVADEFDEDRNGNKFVSLKIETRTNSILAEMMMNSMEIKWYEFETLILIKSWKNSKMIDGIQNEFVDVDWILMDIRW